MGIANTNVATMVIDDINAAGGLLGHPIELFIEDSATDDDTAQAVAAKLIEQERVDVVPGEAQVLLASVDAVLESATQGVEFRLFVESPGPMTLEQVLFDQIW